MISILKTKKLNYKILIKNNKKFIIFFNNNFFMLVKYNNFLLTKNYYILNKSILTLIIKWFSNLNFNITKFNFFGRGYKIITKNKKNILLFNKSHLNILYTKNILIKLNKKNLLYLDYLNNLNIKRNILNIKKLNIYKKIGMRLNKQILLKKKGKNVT